MHHPYPMKHFLAFLTVFAFSLTFGAAEELSEKEGKAVAKEVEDMMALFNKGDAKALLDRTHPAIYKLAGGKDEMFEEAILECCQADDRSSGIKFEGFKAEATEERRTSLAKNWSALFRTPA